MTEEVIIEAAKKYEKSTEFGNIVLRAKGVNSAAGIGFLEGAVWMQEQFEKNRLFACDKNAWFCNYVSVKNGIPKFMEPLGQLAKENEDMLFSLCDVEELVKTFKEMLEELKPARSTAHVRYEHLDSIFIGIYGKDGADTAAIGMTFCSVKGNWVLRLKANRHSRRGRARNDRQRENKSRD